MNQPEFTVEQAIGIQSRQLLEWQELLKPEVFEKLKAWATEKNHLKKRGADVIRGTELSNFIANLKNNYTPPN